MSKYGYLEVFLRVPGVRDNESRLYHKVILPDLERPVARNGQMRYTAMRDRCEVTQNCATSTEMRRSILRTRKVSTRPLLSIDTFYSIRQ